MLNKIKLTNFRRHRDLEVVFGAGMTAIRALNEQGKTTLLESISYALFGVKAIRDSLDDVVTWGEATNSLKVELELGVDGVVYAIKRGKSGAEVNYDGGIVTGQNEVTAFLARLLKVDAGASARLTLSNQNEIRGALESGPKATTELIEKLADFNVIDELIELMEQKLSLGSTATLEATLLADQAELERAQKAAVPVDEAAGEARVLEATEELHAAMDVSKQAEQAVQAAQEAHSVLREAIVARNGLVTALQTASGALQTATQRSMNLVVPAKPDNVEGQVEALQQAITNVEQMDRIRTAHKAVVAHLVRDPEALAYEGTYGDLAAEIEALTSKRADAVALIAQLKGDIRVSEAALTHGSCTFCGKDFSGVPEVAAKNAKLAAQLESAKVSKGVAELAVTGADEDLQALKWVKEADTASTQAGARAEGFVTQVLDGTLPRIYTWTGPELKDTLTVPVLRQEIKALQAQQTTYNTAVVRKSEFEAQVTLAQAVYDTAKAALDAVPEVTLGDAQDKLNAARAGASLANAAVTAANQTVTDAERGMRDALAAYNDAVARVSEIEQRLAEHEKNLATTEFNNALLKRVRQCRPLISDKLWNIVLAAVSSYFSEIRGVASKVTKDSSGFKVDDHPISSMSGSTLDALGLAIRVALVRTFLPSAPFLILDEPAAACDDQRTGNMIGFLASCGFQQVLLCSHDELSESVCDHVIAL